MSLLSFFGRVFGQKPKRTVDMTPEECAAWIRERMEALENSEIPPRIPPRKIFVYDIDNDLFMDLDNEDDLSI